MGMDFLTRVEYSACMRWLRLHRRRLAIVAATASVTLGVHYSYGLFFARGEAHSHLLHLVHSRLCYIPILLGAVFWNWRGGLATAGAITVAVLPYLIWVEPEPAARLGEAIEFVFYFGFGGLTGYFAQSEVRERHAKEEAERRLAESEKLSSLGRLAGGLAHEIKNPLASIRGAAEIIAGGGDPVVLEEFQQILRRETGRLDGAVRDFLNYADPEIIQRDVFALASVIEQRISAERATGPGRDVEWRFQPPPTEIRVEGDLERLGRALGNLARNAAESAAHRHGAAGARVEIGLERSGPHALIRVRDNGTGLDAAQRAAIFTPFFTTKPHGTGLGLATAYRIIRAHGGEIEVESESGEGAAFIVRLPAR